MKTTENILESNKTKYLAPFFEQPQEVLFFDIETTGFSPKSASIYLIGCAFYALDGWHIRQYFAENAGEEAEILRAFTSFASTFLHFVHFNGTTFDVPFITAKCKKHALMPFVPSSQCDIYKYISPYKNLLHLPGCRQKQLEEFIGLYREDIFNGGQLIELYRVYTEQRSTELLHVLLLHNYEDIAGMLQTFSVMAFPKLFEEGCFQIQKAVIDQDSNPANPMPLELLLRLTVPFEFPAACAFHGTDGIAGKCFCTCRGHDVMIKVPVWDTTLKYFFSDYKNYAYLPAEDQAIHKSVAVYVDKSQRMPATAATCYTKKCCRFIPWFGKADKSVSLFYENYKDRQGWVELTDAFLSDNMRLTSYIKNLLTAMKTGHKVSRKL
ncbi:MAG: ribonuclease H-like domain-containing protein [Lachnospiraceae bacterium]|nr:ribonuclease H-like domain-containing protein [Lachnospiraceae bacterium]